MANFQNGDRLTRRCGGPLTFCVRPRESEVNSFSEARSDRLRALQDDGVEAREANTYDEYFGYDDRFHRA